MTTTTEAILTGIRRGFEMGTAPDATRLRELSEDAQSVDMLEESWTNVGETFRTVMYREVSPSRGRSLES